MSTVRFAAPVDLASRAPAGKSVQFPGAVQGSAAGKNFKPRGNKSTLTIHTAYYGK
ncbi:hypothetical protein [Streptomyces katrae]|uniref:hypothetical protein n=1 Tax=Streptomyces katrae TaxID=68223 RepID=UPI000A661CEE|nr:hypothetical protein [Streptomyces katrae]